MSAKSGVARILYKEVVSGDLRKLRAESNDSDTGGGARDFRFGQYPALAETVEKMFPRRCQERRKRDGKYVYLDVFEGTFCFKDVSTGQTVTERAVFEPPTDARPTEGRIARVHEYRSFDPSRVPSTGRVFLLLIQTVDGIVWPHFVEESSLRTPGAWDNKVAEELISCIDADRKGNKVVIGFTDFTDGRQYCNGARNN